MSSVTKRDLNKVARCAEKVAAAREDLRQTIIAARESGESLRDIAAAAGMSHQSVWKMVRERPKPPT